MNKKAVTESMIFLIFRILFAITILILAATIGRSCVHAIFPTTGEMTRSFHNLADVIEKSDAWAPGTAQTVMLVMDSDTMVFGLREEANVLDFFYDSEGQPHVYSQFVRPKECIGNCICLCSIAPYKDESHQLIETPKSDIFIRTCENGLMCRSINLKFPSLMTGFGNVYNIEDVKIRNGFLIERRALPSTVTNIPRRIVVSVEKTKNNEIAVCLNSPCV